MPSTVEPRLVKLLKPGHSAVRTEEKKILIQVKEFVGSGRQGEAYAAVMCGQRVAVKWYKPEWIKLDPMLLDRLRATKICEPPNSRFLWPIDVVTSAEEPGFGYVMPWREPRFREFRELICEQIQPSFRSLVTAGLEIAESYQRLHQMGLCYVDISPGNVAFDLETGEVRICDCDNVDVDGRGWRSAIAGTEGFMAPEIVQNRASPTSWTDLWSLAVLLFWAFVKNHPLQGRKEYEHRLLTKELQLGLWGSEALFIFDDRDKSNWPVEGHNVGALLFWPIYPQLLRDLFTEAFTRGIHYPQQRVKEPRWRTAMARLRDAILPCPNCGQENFYDDRASGQRCWNCDRELPIPRRIVLVGFKIVVASGAGVFRHHLDPRRPPDSAGPVARITGSQRDPDLLEIHNCDQSVWHAILINGDERAVAPGDAVDLQSGMRIVFDDVEAQII